MTDLRVLADHLDIQTAIRPFVYSFDEHRREARDEIFTAGAVIEFRPVGGRLGTRPT